jgi:hypothetical protein
MEKKICIIVLLALAAWIVACTKTAGPGGRATVEGKVFVKNFNSYTTDVISEYYVAGEQVYITYGDQQVVGNSVKTSVDGSYQFRYLNKGHYKVFANSLDTSVHIKGSKKTIPVVMEFDITTNKEVLTLKDIVINK